MLFRSKIECLYWKECPSWSRALEDLQGIVKEEGIDPAEIQVSEVTSEDQAAAVDFYGSPTIRVNQQDVQPVSNHEGARLTCRVYRLRDGRVSPLPDPEDIRSLLREQTG